VTAVPDPTLTPELALRYLDELSTDIRAAVLIDERGQVAAVHPTGENQPAEKLGELAARLFQHADEAADAASGFEGPVSQLEASGGEEIVFAVRAEGWTIAVVAGRFALPSLMFYDLSAVLSDLGRAAA
jgi:predicted regulator of Ras-like GTPase activity (Roadblock/LC7/MglB family)